MKTQIKTGLGGLIAVLVVLSGFSSSAQSGGPNSYQSLLKSVPAPEIPAKAASLVAQSKHEERETIATAVTEAAVGLGPATAPEIVGAIARKVPATAPTVAATAAGLQPKLAEAIAKAAAVSAPTYAGEIVSAICKKLPSLYSQVAVQVAAAVPGARQSILTELRRALPTLRPFLERATFLATVNSPSVPSIDAVMALTTILVQRAADRSSVTPEQIVAVGIPPQEESQVMFSSLDLLQGSVNPPRPGLKPGQTNHGRGHAYGHANFPPGP